MPIHAGSRYLRVNVIQVKDADGDVQRVYELPQTTVSLEQKSLDAATYTVSEGETFESIAHREYGSLGGSDLWWVLAMYNPHIFYPLDMSAGDVIEIPPARWVESFMRSADNWEETWRTSIRS